MYKGKKVAFIASGGGGRGVAHGGVIKACEEKGIEFDMTIGASAGAICVAILANFKSADHCIDLFRRGKENKYGFNFGWRNMISMINFFSKDIRRGLFDMAGTENYFADLDDYDFNVLSEGVHDSLFMKFKYLLKHCKESERYVLRGFLDEMFERVKKREQQNR